MVGTGVEECPPSLEAFLLTLLPWGARVNPPLFFLFRLFGWIELKLLVIDSQNPVWNEGIVWIAWKLEHHQL